MEEGIRDRQCRRKTEQRGTNGINDGIRNALYRMRDFPTEQKCHLGTLGSSVKHRETKFSG